MTVHAHLAKRTDLEGPPHLGEMVYLEQDFRRRLLDDRGQPSIVSSASGVSGGLAVIDPTRAFQDVIRTGSIIYDESGRSATVTAYAAGNGELQYSSSDPARFDPGDFIYLDQETTTAGLYIYIDDWVKITTE